jgi:CubicO group peptidase (beta-lactamase class C family)
MFRFQKALWVVGSACLLLACSGDGQAEGPPCPNCDQVAAIAQDAMATYDLRALILRVTVDDQPVFTEALGESLPGVPATADMKVRNGFVAYSYLTTILLELVDDPRMNVHLSDPLSKYLPDLPRADQITLLMLANSTSGYADYVYRPEVEEALKTDPDRQWSTDELIQIGTSAAPMFAPGTNWAYAHTNYAILGKVLEKAAGKPLSDLMAQYIFKPMGLRHTQGSDTPDIPPPVLHTFSTERDGTYEDSTLWNPSWTAPAGALQTSDAADLATSIAAIGSGKLLSPASRDAQVLPHLIGFGHKVGDGSCPACRQNTEAFSFGLAVILQGPWITGNKFFAGSGAAVGYLPQGKVAIAVITTYRPDAFDPNGNVKQDAGQAILSSVAAAMAPDHPLPAPR